jgi:hypothetical protein
MLMLITLMLMDSLKTLAGPHLLQHHSNRHPMPPADNSDDDDDVEDARNHVAVLLLL